MVEEETHGNIQGVARIDDGDDQKLPQDSEHVEEGEDHEAHTLSLSPLEKATEHKLSHLVLSAHGFSAVNTDKVVSSARTQVT